MSKNRVTQNIYTSWVETIDRNNRIRRLDKFSQDELQHLLWLINEELNSRKDVNDETNSYKIN